MGWMADEYHIITRRHAPAVITGKPLGLGGSLGRDEATGRGAFLVIEELARRRRIDPGRARVAVQGFGNAGYHVARLLQGAGYRVVAVSDSQGGIHADAGFDIESLYRQKQATRHLDGVYCEGSVCREVAHTHLTNAELLELDVDLLVPAALENQITSANVDRIRAQIVVEVANGPVAADVDARLHDRGVVVVPDVLANTGGVTVSWFEWVQNRQGFPWTLEEVRQRLAATMTRAFDDTWAVAEADGVSLRSAAYGVAFRRLDTALAALGTRAYFRGESTA